MESPSLELALNHEAQELFVNNYEDFCKQVKMACEIHPTIKKVGKITTNLKTKEQLIQEIKFEKAELESFRGQWAEISSPLYERIESLQNEFMVKRQRKHTLLNRLHEVKKHLIEKSEEIKNKDAYIEELGKKVKDDLPPSRTFYTQRIIDQVNDIKKQDAETQKVLDDIKRLQKEINFLTEKVQRAYAITDEVIFKSAKNSEWNRRCYKLLATLHRDFDQLLDSINEIGAIRRDILQLEGTVSNFQNLSAL